MWVLCGQFEAVLAGCWSVSGVSCEEATQFKYLSELCVVGRQQSSLPTPGQPAAQ